MIIRPIDNFRRFVISDGRPVYVRANAFTSELWVRVHKTEFLNVLRLVEPTHHVAYQPRAHGVDVYCIERKGLCETFDA